MLTASGKKDLKASMTDGVFVIGRDAVPSVVRLEAGETLRWTLVILPGVSANLSVEIDLDGPGASVDVAGLYLCPASENISLNILVKHNSGACHSRQLFKGIVGGDSRASFDGLIYVRQDAQKTKAYQENHSILLSDTARAESRPQLEIYADDVECSHGSTSGFLNEDELFYMRSRGIPEAEARRLQMISFLAPVAERLPEDLKTEVYDSLS